jgi:hypothetical protein
MNNNPYESPDDTNDNASWFVPYIILTLILITNFAYEAFSVLQQGRRVNAEINRIVPALPQAESISRTLDGISRDIVKLSQSNAAAARIRKEFNIEIRENATAP